MSADFLPLTPSKPLAGGAKRARSASPARKATRKPKTATTSSYKRTTRVHTSKDGKKRTIYTKAGSEYVQRRSKKTGEVRYVKI